MTRPIYHRSVIGWPDTVGIFWIMAGVTVTSAIAPEVPLGLAAIGALFRAWELTRG